MRAALVVLGAAFFPGGGAAMDSPALADARLVQAWRVLRAMDCARCHGKDYDGLAAPSIVEYARTQSRDRFVRMILDGEPARGMPGYRASAPVAHHVDDIHRYFVARAAGTIDARARARADE